MLKQLLKYEFKATKRLYFGLYLALALLSVVLGVTFRQEHALAHSTSFQNLEVILMIVYRLGHPCHRGALLREHHPALLSEPAGPGRLPDAHAAGQ